MRLIADLLAFIGQCLTPPLRTFNGQRITPHKPGDALRWWDIGHAALRVSAGMSDDEQQSYFSRIGPLYATNGTGIGYAAFISLHVPRSAVVGRPDLTFSQWFDVALAVSDTGPDRMSVAHAITAVDINKS